MKPLPQPVSRPQLRPARMVRQKTSHDLPPSARQPKSTRLERPGKKARTGTFWKWLCRSAVVATVVSAAFAFIPKDGVATPLGTAENNSANWDHHAEATDHQQPMKWVSTKGAAGFGATIAFDLDDDQDSELTNKLVRGGTTNEMNAAVRAAQADLQPGPPAQAEPDAPQPSISEGMRYEILTGDKKFYHIMLFDSCAEDGDVVDVIIDGHPFARVPITHAGSTLSVPLSSGSKIEILGVRDGAGGITVACATSRGEGFLRVLSPGERQVLSVIPGK